MGGKDTDSAEITKLKHQLNSIQTGAEQRERALYERLEQQQKRNDDQINSISQNFAQNRQSSNRHPSDRQPQFHRNFNSKIKCFVCGKEGHKADSCQSRGQVNRAVKKVCSHHGENFSHTSAECLVLLNKQQRNDTRAGRLPQNVHFLDDSHGVATNNNDLAKYKFVFDSPDARTASNLEIEEKSNLFSSKCSQWREFNSVWKIGNEDTEQGIENEKVPKFTPRKSKNVKVSSSSPYLAEA
ncbi:MAG TPA: hypothetical protein VER35_01025 [Candidatus Limnocylindrales bacterium]|nr:hypothetical protein [Candidatus Limnocylindrales bacterium]